MLGQYGAAKVPIAAAPAACCTNSASQSAPASQAAAPARPSRQVANACLVHKLGRSVQLVKLHAELQCAVLGGGRGGGSAAGADGALCAGRGIGRVLQWWDYEGALGRQVRPAARKTGQLGE